jgi:hypothetical protein
MGLTKNEIEVLTIFSISRLALKNLGKGNVEKAKKILDAYENGQPFDEDELESLMAFQVARMELKRGV